MQCSQIQEEKVTYIPQQLNCMRKTCRRGVHGKTLNTDLQSRPPSISFAGTSTRIMKELEEDGEGQKEEICAGMLCVSGSTIPSKMGIHNCKLLLTNVRKPWTMTLIILESLLFSSPFFCLFFFFPFFKPKNLKTQQLSDLFLAEQKSLLTF